jgi:hypothetical protein
MSRCAAVSCIANLAKGSEKGRAVVLAAGSFPLLMNALAQLPAAVRPRMSRPQWPGTLRAPVHAANVLLLLVEGAANGRAVPGLYRAVPVQVRCCVSSLMLESWLYEYECGGLEAV